jgi:hypothetical protein
VDLPLAADRAGPAPLTIQIVGQLRTAMTDGQLAAAQRAARQAGMRIGLYLDLAVGAAPDWWGSSGDASAQPR